MNNLRRLFNYWLWGENEITQEDLAYYKEHPEKLDEYINKDMIHIRFLQFYFFLSLLMVIIIKSLIFYYSETWNKYLIEVILDILYKCALALLGGTIIAYLLGYLRQKEYHDNREYKQAVRQLLEAEKNNQDEIK